jgi:hypothetical protein
MGGAVAHIHAVVGDKIYIVYIACHIYCIFNNIRYCCDKIRQKTRADSLGNLCIFRSVPWVFSGLSFAIFSLKTTLFELVFLLLISDSATGLSAIFLPVWKQRGRPCLWCVLTLWTNNIFYCSSDHANNKLGLIKWVYHVHFFLISSLARIETFLLMGLWKTVAFFRAKECIPFSRSNVCR